MDGWFDGLEGRDGFSCPWGMMLDKFGLSEMD